jgi:hypothetical protein
MTTERQAIYGLIEQERERQIALGYTREHDLEHGGVEHVLEQAYDYVNRAYYLDPEKMRGHAIKAAALLVAAVELMDAPA